MVIFAVWMFLTIGTLLVQYCNVARVSCNVTGNTCNITRLYQQCTNRQKQSKTVKQQKKWPLVYQLSHVYTESAEYSTSASAEYTKPIQLHCHNTVGDKSASLLYSFILNPLTVTGGGGKLHPKPVFFARCSATPWNFLKCVGDFSWIGLGYKVVSDFVPHVVSKFNMAAAKPELVLAEWSCVVFDGFSDCYSWYFDSLLLINKPKTRRRLNRK